MLATRPLFIALFALAAFIGGCDLLDTEQNEDIICAYISVPAVRLTVVSAVPGDVLDGDVFVVARDGAYADSVRLEPRSSHHPEVYLAPERAGTYTVEVRTEGYHVWQREKVEVEQGICHVKTVELTALLSPVDAS